MRHFIRFLFLLGVGIASNAYGQEACDVDNLAVFVVGSANMNERLDNGEEKTIKLGGQQSIGTIYCAPKNKSASKVEIDIFDCGNKTILKVSWVAGIVSHKCKAAPKKAVVEQSKVKGEEKDETAVE